jgi:2-amino-4-hydroxy-6-hydroxymethyldihydropteridine diphosphokinase
MLDAQCFKNLLPLYKNRTMSLVYLGLGTNLGDKPLNLNSAVKALSVEVGDVLSVSTFYASTSWGFESENEFLNAVVLVETNLPPFELLAKTQEIERSMGRSAKTTSGYEDRTIDIDILLYDKLIIEQPTLKIPHPLILKRDFVRIPLLEIAPELVDPVSNKKFRLL